MWKETFDLYTDDLMSQNGCVPATGLAGHISHDTGRTRIERVVGFTVLPTAQLFLGADPSPFQIRLMGAGHISLLFQMNLKDRRNIPIYSLLSKYENSGFRTWFIQS